jgi:hypothetical protein
VHANVIIAAMRLANHSTRALQRARQWMRAIVDVMSSPRDRIARMRCTRKFTANEKLNRCAQRRAIRSPKNILNEASLFSSESVKSRNASATIARASACKKCPFHRYFFDFEQIDQQLVHKQLTLPLGE